jgi:hypothetical protein
MDVTTPEKRLEESQSEEMFGVDIPATTAATG